MQEKLEELEQLVIDARFECTRSLCQARSPTTEYAATLNKMLGLIRPSTKSTRADTLLFREWHRRHLNLLT